MLFLAPYFSVDYPLKFGSWSGRFVNRVVSEVLEGVGIKVPHNAREKPFTVTPILDLESNVVGELIPGNQYWFRVSLFCSEVDCGSVVDAFTKPTLRLSTGMALNVVKASVAGGELSLQGSDYRAVVRWRVRFWPTSFIFRSHYVTWPSPARFLSSAGLTLARVLRGVDLLVGRGSESLVGVIGGVDLKGFVRDLVFNTEVLGMRVRRLVLNLGRGRRVPAFEGVAEYVTYTDRPSLFRLLLDVVNAYGVGKNRALGLGYVVADVVDIKRLSRGR
ncbi:Protein of unknown function DUF2276 [Vulcanisaeta distributa DSM 14429]|uniref:CRISPR-associated protein Cas6 C-terminal domain-containing protein n=2 Tax=Vulcanisaeta distributa TaxID=164451 RepID=E1QU68_VULDI|nr:Protein of unknown function DUF2276 [Vulcanisaeta distributa DSM 14429]